MYIEIDNNEKNFITIHKLNYYNIFDFRGCRKETSVEKKFVTRKESFQPL